MKWALIIILNTMALVLIIKNRSTVKRYFDACFKLMIWVLTVAAVIVISFVVYQCRSDLKAFFTDYTHVFTGVGYTAIALGLFLTVLQIWDAKKKARASFSYQLFKDGREIRKSVSRVSNKIIESEDISKFSVADRFRALAKIGESLQYYACAYQQRAYGNIDENEVKAILEEFCYFLKRPQVTKFWKDKIADNELWDEEFRIKGRECLRQRGDC